MSLRSNYIFTFVILLLCTLEGIAQDSTKARLEFDHVLLFVSNEDLKDSLDVLFTPAEKLTTVHENQGTKGYYYLFFNTYIELLFLEDPMKAAENSESFGSDYVLRWSDEDRYSPVGIGMTLSPWDTSLIMDDFRVYQSADSPEGEYYLMSDFNDDPSQPMIYVSQPRRAHEALDSIEDVNTKPEEIREDLRLYLTHPNGIKRLTNVIYTYADHSSRSGNVDILHSSSVMVKPSEIESITMIFDNNSDHHKEFMINDRVKLIVEY